MTSTAPILPPGIGSLPSLGPAPSAQRSFAGRTAVDGQRPTEGATGARGQAPALPGREAPGLQPSDPTQQTAPPLQPGRPLIGGGPFTLAVAFGLQAEQSQQAPSPGSADSPAQAAQAAATQSASAEGATGPDQLTEEERKVVRELQQRDQEVRRHEAAHAAAGGQYAGAPTYTYQRGPDGKQYAVGGSVSIDTSPVKGDPEATLQKARQIRAAALAPAEPSAQDRSVAASAAALERQAQAEIAAERRAEQTGEAADQPASSAAASEVPPAANVVSQGAGEQPGDGGTITGLRDSPTRSAGFNPVETSAEASTGFGPSSEPTASPFDIAGPIARASTGFDSRIPAPRVVSITV